MGETQNEAIKYYYVHQQRKAFSGLVIQTPTVSHLLYLVDLCLPSELQLVPQGLHLVVMLLLELCSRQ